MRVFPEMSHLWRSVKLVPFIEVPYILYYTLCLSQTPNGSSKNEIRMTSVSFCHNFYVWLNWPFIVLPAVCDGLQVQAAGVFLGSRSGLCVSLLLSDPAGSGRWSACCFPHDSRCCVSSCLWLFSCWPLQTLWLFQTCFHSLSSLRMPEHFHSNQDMQWIFFFSKVGTSQG